MPSRPSQKEDQIWPPNLEAERQGNNPQFNREELAALLRLFREPGWQVLQRYLKDRRDRAVAAISDPNEILGDSFGAYPLRQAFRSGQIDGVRCVSFLPQFVAGELAAMTQQEGPDETV